MSQFNKNINKGTLLESIGFTVLIIFALFVISIIITFMLSNTGFIGDILNYKNFDTLLGLIPIFIIFIFVFFFTILLYLVSLSIKINAIIENMNNNNLSYTQSTDSQNILSDEQLAAFNMDLMNYVNTENLHEILECIYEKNTNINFQDENGKTPLIIAVIKGNKDIVRALINAGADLNIKDNDNKTALDYAENNNFEEIKKIILDGKR
ncbi:ankyrin repeat domain-containing protein [Brachyspira catarrhinii]|uniref:Ankyrin repeat domain-containing protein n=1 Tax=Brachyspira catarrhinii TaxID=2528966 RepID=A0ABY2TQ15_9SPIR|nr:ankyrin repeat domain-containing protein [Brachyspira catarrhinii]TKZ32334.1 ankyrin repeat domain-containing protein [Brachyspira catarrhinii]